MTHYFCPLGRKNRLGFTLVELLVVIAIIALLAAILFPVFARARENARRTTCMSNIRNIGLGIRQYAQDVDGTLPLVSVYPAAQVNANAPYGWADAIEPYLKTPGVYQCLSEPTEPNADPTQIGYIDYYFNANLNNLVEANFTYISNTILVGDGQISTTIGSHIGDAQYAISGGNSGTAANPVLADLSLGCGTRHMGGSDYCFADGHVKWYHGIPSSTSSSCGSQSGSIYDGTSPPTGSNATFAYH